MSSLAASVTDLTLLYLLVRLADARTGLAATAASLVGGLVNFVLSRRWVFSARDLPASRQAARYLVGVVACGAALSGLVVHVAAVLLGLPLLAAKGIAAAAVLGGWNYPVGRHWVFGRS